MKNKSFSVQCMSGTTSGSRCTRKTNSPDGMCPQHRDNPIPLNIVSKSPGIKMPPPKVVTPEVKDAGELHGVKMLPIAKDIFLNNLKTGNYAGTAAGMLAVGIVSAQAYYEASQKLGWTWTKSNRHLRHLNAALPSALEEGSFLPNKHFWEELDDNKYEAQNDRSYLIEPTSDRHVHLTVSLQRNGMEEDSREAKASGNRKAAKIYKEFSKILIGLLYEEDPAAAADKYADDLEALERELPTKDGIALNRFKIPYYQRATTEEQHEARRNVIARYRDTAATLRGENKKPEVSVPTQAEFDVTRSKTKSGTYYRLT